MSGLERLKTYPRFYPHVIKVLDERCSDSTREEFMKEFAEYLDEYQEENFNDSDK